MNRRGLQAKDLRDSRVLDAIDVVLNPSQNAWGGRRHCSAHEVYWVVDTLSPVAIPQKVFWAKLRSMEKRGLIRDWCGCGRSSHLWLTSAARERARD